MTLPATIGDWVCWSVDVGDGVTPEELGVAFDAAGLGRALMPPPPVGSTAARRAVDDAARNTILSTHDRGGVIEWVMADKHGELRVAYLGAQGKMISDHDTDKSRAILGRFGDLRNRHPRAQIVDMITDCLRKWGGVKLLGPGIWFVRPRYADEARKLQAVIGSLGNSCLSVVELPGTGGAKRLVARGLRGEVTARLGSLMREAESWRGAPRPSTVDRRLAAVSAVGDVIEEIQGLGRPTDDLEAMFTDTLSAIREFSPRHQTPQEPPQEPQPQPEPIAPVEVVDATELGTQGQDEVPEPMASPPPRPAKPYQAMSLPKLKREAARLKIDITGMKKDEIIMTLLARG